MKCSTERFLTERNIEWIKKAEASWRVSLLGVFILESIINVLHLGEKRDKSLVTWVWERYSLSAIHMQISDNLINANQFIFHIVIAELWHHRGYVNRFICVKRSYKNILAVWFCWKCFERKRPRKHTSVSLLISPLPPSPFPPCWLAQAEFLSSTVTRPLAILQRHHIK